MRFLKRRFLALGIMCSLCIGLLAGCSFPGGSSDMTADKLISKSRNAMTSVKSYSMDLNMEYNIKVDSQDGSSSNMGMGLDSFSSKIIRSKDGIPQAGYIHGDVNADMYGVDVSAPLELYMDKSEGNGSVYASTNKGSWTVEPLNDANNVFGFVVELVNMQTSADWTLSDKVETMGGVEVYKLTSTVNGSLIKNLLTLNTGALVGDEDVVFPDVKVTEYIDVDTHYVLGVHVTMSDDSEAMRMANDVSSYEFDCLDIKATYNNFNVYSESDVAVPEDVKSVAKSQVGSKGVLADIFEGNGGTIVQDSDWDVESTSELDDSDMITRDGFSVGFESTHELKDIDIEKNYLTVSGEDSNYRIHAHIGKWFDGKDSVNEERMTTNKYYNDLEGGGEVKDILIGDLRSTNLEQYPVYWYSSQYTHVDADKTFSFVYKEYSFCVDLGNNMSCDISIEEYSDVGSQVNLTDEAALKFLSQFVIEKAADVKD